MDNTYIETGLDLHKWIADSGSSKLTETSMNKDNFEDLIKDLNLGCCSESEIMQIRFLEELIGYCKQLGAVRSASSFMRDVFVIISTSRSRKGFEREMIATQISKSEHSLKGDTKTLMERFGLIRNKQPTPGGN